MKWPRFYKKKITKCFLESKINLYSWEKKTKVKVHLQNFWNKKGPEKQKYSTWNFEITMCIWNIFFQVWKVIFFLKRTRIFKIIILKWNPSKKKTSAIFQFFVVNCGKIQGQFVISVFKTEIRKWSQIWCLCLSRL